jgi:methyl-accepting chemotaxis protein
MSLFPRTKNTSLSTPANSARSHDEKGVWVDAATIETITRVCLDAAAGTLESRIVCLPMDHPLKAMADAINSTLDRVDAFVRESSAMMKHCSQDRFYRPLLLQGLSGAFRQSAVTINNAGNKMRLSHTQFQEISRLAEDNAVSLNTVASASEELNATTSEISRQAFHSTEFTKLSVERVDHAKASVARMTDAVHKIEEIVSLIESIADQTNLLALNAMIEASRAGQKGSRFAVVASEVKELARNTSKATEKIIQQVSQMREVSKQTESAFLSIHATIADIDASANQIQRTVADQVAATEEVAQSIGEVAGNTAQVSEKIHLLQTSKNDR